MLTDIQAQVLRMAEILEDKKAVDVLILDISKLTVLADYFLIASGRSETQVKALYDELEKRTAETGWTVRHRDGYQGGRWLVLDYGDIIVHLFHQEERRFYDLERLWADAAQVRHAVSSRQDG